MAAVIVDVAEAVKEEIKLVSPISRAITPKRLYVDFDVPLEEIGQLRVDVMPKNVSRTELYARGITHYEASVTIGVRYRFGPERRTAFGEVESSEIDNLILLVQQLHDYFVDEGNGRRLSTYTVAVWRETELLYWFDPKHLREHSQFTGLLSVGYDVGVAQ